MMPPSRFTCGFKAVQAMLDAGLFPNLSLIFSYRDEQVKFQVYNLSLLVLLLHIFQILNFFITDLESLVFNLYDTEKDPMMFIYLKFTFYCSLLSNHQCLIFESSSAN